MRLLVSFLVFAIYNVHSAKILGLFPHVGESHFIVFESLLKDLAKRGHQVTVVSFFPQRDPLMNYTDVSLRDIAEPRKEAVNLQEFDKPNRIINSLGLEMFIRQIISFQPLKHMALKICSKLVQLQPLAKVLQEDYDVVLVENFNSDCMLGLLHVYQIQAPVVSVLSCPPMQWSSRRIGLTDNPSYMPTISSEFNSRMSFMQRLQNVAMDAYFKLWFRCTIQLKEQEIIEKHFRRKIPDLDLLARNVTMMIVNTFHSLNGVRPLLPGFVQVGGMHLGNRRSQSIPQAEDIVEYVRQKTKYTPRVQLLESHRNVNFRAFVVRVPTCFLHLVMEEDFWPQGVVFRRFRGQVPHDRTVT